MLPAVDDSPANIKDFWARAFEWFDRYFSAAVEVKPVDVKE